VLDRRLVFVSGKGGVGKSAVTAALALRAAATGRRVLTIGLVDGLGLATHLGVEELGYEPAEVQPGVAALAVDRARALDEYLRLQLRVPRAAPTRQFTRALNVLVDTAPGVREIISMGKPVFDMWRGDHDLIAVDAPPLGQLMSYLRAPATIADLVPSGPIRHQAEALRDALADTTACGLLLVTTAEELPVVETTEALEAVAAARVIELVGVVANRVLDPLPLQGDLAEVPPGPHRAAALLHQRIAAEHRLWLDRLPEHTVLPFLFGLLTPGEVAARLSELWVEP
jgi:anion-transporting  ArsA/GET3 family ATPase